VGEFGWPSGVWATKCLVGRSLECWAIRSVNPPWIEVVSLVRASRKSVGSGSVLQRSAGVVGLAKLTRAARSLALRALMVHKARAL
jgi:hypothetical protein